jgi:hypothetical protein
MLPLFELERMVHSGVSDTATHRLNHMNQPSIMQSPECSICKQPMVWQSVELVSAKPVNVFHCKSCDNIAAAETLAPNSL